MLIPCVSCESAFWLDDNHIKAVGSKVRCSKCEEIFMVFPPDHDAWSKTKKSTSNSDVATDIPKVKYSLLDNLFQGQNKTNEVTACIGKGESHDNSLNESIKPLEDLEDVEKDEHIAYNELPDLSEIEEIVDSILDEKDHINKISPDIQAKCSLTQDLNFSGDYSSKPIDRREFARVKTQNLISYFSFDKNRKLSCHGLGIALDISKGGILLETPCAVKSSFLLLTATDKMKKVIEVNGRLIYAKKSSSGTYYCGIEFVGNDRRVKGFITKLIKEYNFQRNNLYITLKKRFFQKNSQSNSHKSVPAAS